MSSLNLDEKIFSKFNPTNLSDSGYEGFIDEKEGLVIRAFKGKVDQMVYLASATDRLRCPEYAQDPQAFVRIYFCGLIMKFDEFGKLRLGDEKARLDNFAIQLARDENTIGYIIVYAGRIATAAEAQIRANRARDYLISVRKIDPQRVKAIDAGHHEDFTIQLYVLPAGSEPPPPSPSVDPSEVQIIYEKKQTKRKRP
ncbi:MAG TPA: hypothetical protein VFI24_22030 [Pyrinomonadaceae bacterium]|nr:hypothetical protein [Pyrinomonadaceae bacterium]